MKRTIRTAAAGLLLLACLLPGGMAGALEIVGPSTAPAGQAVTLELTGLPPIDLQKPIGDSLKWMGSFKIVASAPATESTRLRQSLSIDFAGSKWLMSVTFTPTKSGTVVVAAALNGELVQHRVEVGHSPQQPPDPIKPIDPIDPPPVDKVTQVTYVYEKSTPIPREMAATLDKLNQEKGILATLFEQDTKDKSGQVPEQYKIARDAAIATGIPCLVVQSGAKVVRVKVSPKTAADVLEGIQ